MPIVGYFRILVFKAVRMKHYITCLLIFLTSIAPAMAIAQVITVTGAIEPNEMGLTLIHEHVMVDWIGADSTGYHRWNRKEVVERALPYLKELKKYGTASFLDCTPAYLGRDPYVLRELAERSGLQILTNTGYYGAGSNKYVPESAMEASPREMAAIWIKEFRDGIDGSGIRPGFIKIAVENEDSLSQMHTKLVKAAALTHLKTGMTIVSHTGADGPAMAQLKVLKEMGVSPNAFVWTHAQNGTMEGYLKAASLGAWISLDNIDSRPGDKPDGHGNIDWFVKTLLELKENGILDHILIAHDAGWYNVGEKNGGYYRGYTDLFTELIPRLKENGFDQTDIDKLLKENPKRAYAIEIRKQ